MKKLSSRGKFCYAIGNLGYGTLAQTVNNFIMFFGTSVLGISGSLVGLAIAISTLWDGLSDPLVGYLSDKTNSKRFGKRLGYMFFSTFGMALCNILLWIIPTTLPMGIKFLWLLVMLLLLETCNTFFATPYTALGIDIAPEYNDQSALQGYKTVFFIIGMILPSLLMVLFMPNGNGAEQGQFNQLGYINIAYVNSILAIICGAICIIGTLKKGTEKTNMVDLKPKEKHAFVRIFTGFFSTLKRKNYGAVILGYSVALISAAFLTAVGMHLFTFSYHFTSTQIPILMTGLFLGAIVSQPVWLYISKRIDKKPTLNISLAVILAGIGLTLITFIFRDFILNDILFWFVLPCIFVCGFGTGALYSLPISMYADVITIEKLETGENKAATYSGYMTLAFNIANSIALLIIGFLLDAIKFNPSQPVQPLSVQNGLGMIVFVGCGISIALAILIFSKYTIKRSDVLKAEMKKNRVNVAKKK